LLFAVEAIEQVYLLVAANRFSLPISGISTSRSALTGLANRASLIEALDRALVTLPVHGDTLAVHFIDVDRFKEVNDSLGHDSGDFLLKTVAERLRALVRIDDIVARLGGDEFVVVQRGLTKRDAEVFAGRIADAPSI
jgi:diguanylate cyclase (GGDEF)-like protein